MMSYTADEVKVSAPSKRFSVHDDDGDKLCEFAEMMNEYENHVCLPASRSNEALSIVDLTAEIYEDDCVYTSKVPERNMAGFTKVPKRKMTTFTLPPDYDRNDSKWTLRYRHPAPELTELIPSSGIYVNAAKLSKCHERADNCRLLAGLLMMEVFSDSALKVCSVTGAKPRCAGETAVRPGLDKEARVILMAYVKTYGLNEGWCVEKPRAIVRSMHYRLHKYRSRNQNSL